MAIIVMTVIIKSSGGLAGQNDTPRDTPVTKSRGAARRARWTEANTVPIRQSGTVPFKVPSLGTLEIESYYTPLSPRRTPKVSRCLLVISTLVPPKPGCRTRRGEKEPNKEQDRGNRVNAEGPRGVARRRSASRRRPPENDAASFATPRRAAGLPRCFTMQQQKNAAAAEHRRAGPPGPAASVALKSRKTEQLANESRDCRAL